MSLLNNNDIYHLYESSILNEANIINLDEFINSAFKHYDINDYIRRWLNTHFKKYLIKLDPERLGNYIKPFTPTESHPEWMKGKELYQIFEIPYNLRRHINHILDWMESLDERGLKKLDRITFEQALDHANKWVEDINRKAKDEEDWDNVETVMEWPDGFKMVLIKGDVCLSREGKLMGHCVGGGNYKNANIFSLRDKNNEPHATIEVKNGSVFQIKGKQNRAPIEKYHSYIKEFITREGLDIEEDGHNIGMVKFNNLWYDPDSEEWQEIYEGQIIPSQEEAIERILSRVKDGVIDGSVDLYHLFLKELPDLSNVKVITGNFSCADNQITSLKGAPRKVGGSFYCNSNQLTSLEGGPREVGGAFNCNTNQLQTLKGGPREVGGLFNCVYNQLQTLEGAPIKVGDSFYCFNNQLQTLEGAPREVRGHFNCIMNPLQTLKGAPREVGGNFQSDQFSDQDYREYISSIKTESFKNFYYNRL